MGRNMKENQFRTNRRPDHDHSSDGDGNGLDRIPISNSSSESEINPLNFEMGIGDSAEDPNPNPNINWYSTYEGKGRGLFTDEQLEEIMFQNLESVCKEVISKLVSFGYNEEEALKAVLSNGYWHGEMCVMGNIFENSLSYLNSEDSVLSENPDEPNFSDLRMLLECTLESMVGLLQTFKPHLRRGDAIWCLLMSELDVARARSMEIPVLSTPDGNVGSSNVEGGVGNGLVEFPYKFHGGSGFENGGPNECSTNMALQREVSFPNKSYLTPVLKNLLKKNVSAVSARVREEAKNLQNQSQDSKKIGDSSEVTETGSEESQKCMKCINYMKGINDDKINSILSKFRDLHIQSTETGRFQIDPKDQEILSVIQEIKDLEKQVNERKEWAHQKAMQAARKLCNDLSELKKLRVEKEETELIKKGKQVLEDNTMKKLAEMENALRRASGQVDRANSAVRKLENENAEIRAESEAFKLSASESEKTNMEVTKREKKGLKMLSAIEKQTSKLQNDIAAEIQKISDLEKQLAQVEASQKESEVKWRQEQKAKEQALAKVEEERRHKEAAEANNKRMLESMHQKIEIDSQRYKDDLHRLEQELSQLKAPKQSHALSMQNGLETPQDSAGRSCILCLEDAVSVVFLPCAHQVLCAKCNDSYGMTGNAACPCCRVLIQQRVCVFGATS